MNAIGGRISRPAIARRSRTRRLAPVASATTLAVARAGPRQAPRSTISELPRSRRRLASRCAPVGPEVLATRRRRLPGPCIADALNRRSDPSGRARVSSARLPPASRPALRPPTQDVDAAPASRPVSAPAVRWKVRPSTRIDASVAAAQRRRPRAPAGTTAAARRCHRVSGSRAEHHGGDHGREEVDDAPHRDPGRIQPQPLDSVDAPLEIEDPAVGADLHHCEPNSDVTVSRSSAHARRRREQHGHDADREHARRLLEVAAKGKHGGSHGEARGRSGSSPQRARCHPPSRRPLPGAFAPLFPSGVWSRGRWRKWRPPPRHAGSGRGSSGRIASAASEQAAAARLPHLWSPRLSHLMRAGSISTADTSHRPCARATSISYSSVYWPPRSSCACTTTYDRPLPGAQSRRCDRLERQRSSRERHAAHCSLEVGRELGQRMPAR